MILNEEGIFPLKAQWHLKGRPYETSCEIEVIDRVYEITFTKMRPGCAYRTGDSFNISEYEVTAWFVDDTAQVITDQCTFTIGGTPIEGYVFQEAGTPDLMATVELYGKTRVALCGLIVRDPLPQYIYAWDEVWRTWDEIIPYQTGARETDLREYREKWASILNHIPTDFDESLPYETHIGNSAIPENYFRIYDYAPPYVYFRSYYNTVEFLDENFNRISIHYTKYGSYNSWQPVRGSGTEVSIMAIRGSVNNGNAYPRVIRY